ncbi:hypothetical protein [Arthrobacter sp. H-02-3]|uniref:hypothetical protein n=1 Tax=Arthrobacter sp. H-02-3 TaxID=2703675 RepID=UPI0010582381|nr:hypothetical protein [Arthrobacter sp. H-02-3]
MGKPLVFRNDPIAGLSLVRGSAVLLSLALAATGCTSESPLAASAQPSTTTAKCASPSRIVKSAVNGTEVEGSSEDGITLYGQVQSEGFLLASETEIKIVWRISGSGQPAVTVTSPGGGESSLAWGPEFHSSSNYARPGDEYSTALLLDQPGCWNIKFTRDARTANVWLQVGT